MAASAENDCCCTNISIMQLFHELKQKFPAVPDRVVSECIRQNFHDKGTCEAILSRENASYLLHSYPPSLKMSSSEPESSLSAKLQNLALCDKCKLGQPCCTYPCTSSNQPCESVPFDKNLNITGAQFLKESSRLISSSNPQILPASRFQPHTSDSAFGEANSVKRSENRWIYQEVEKDVNNAQLLHQSVSSKSQDDTTSSSVFHSNQFNPCDVFNPHLQPSGGNISALTANKSCIRQTSLNTDQSHFQHHQQTYSAPVIPSNFEPFHSNNNNKNLPCGSVCAGPNNESKDSHVKSEHLKTGPSSGKSELNSHNLKNFMTGNNSTNFHEEDSQQDDQTVVNSYQFNVNCRLHGGRTSSTVNVSGTSTHTVNDNTEPHQKGKSVIHMQPAPHYANQNIWGGDNTSAQTSNSVSALPHQPRSYTSVNLTLRPPTSEPQAPIDIHSKGSSLMYSTSSYDPNQGFRSQLKICIGPGGTGSVSAMRTQVHDPGLTSQARPRVPQFVPVEEPHKENPVLRTSRPVPSIMESTLESTTSSESTFQEQLSIRMDHLHTATQVLLRQQLERKNRLQLELRREREKLRAMQRNVRGMEKDLARRQLAKSKALPSVTTVVQKVQKLKQEIHTLTKECQKMAQEVDNFADARVPLGETDEEFYKNIYTGQRGYVGTGPSSYGAPPHRSTSHNHEPPVDSDAREGRSWTCSECTFRNYWELKYCEQCYMPRIVLGTDSPSINSCYCHPSTSKSYPPNPLTTIPLMRSASPPKLN